MNADSDNNYQYRDDADHNAYVDRQLNRQRGMIYVLAGALALLVVLSLAGYDFNLGALLDHNQEAPTTNDEQAPTPIDTSYSPALLQQQKPPAFKAPLKLLEQKNAQVVQGLCVVATHTGLPRKDRTLPKDHEWLPQVTSDLGIAFCDHNRVLDAALPGRAQNMLARFTLPLDFSALQRIYDASGTRNLILVEYANDASYWTVRGICHDSTQQGLPEAIRRTWPDKNALASLREDISRMASLLTGFALSTEGVFEISDQSAHQYTLYLDALRQDKPEAETFFDALRQSEPAFEFPIYRRISKLINPSQPEGIYVAMQMLEDYVNAQGKDKRLLNLFASTAYLSKSHYERAYMIAESQVAEDPLNMAAYTARMNLEDDVRKLRGQARIEQEELYSNGIRDYPQDGRYHIALAKALYIDPATVDRSVEAAQQAYELRPWSDDTLYHVGFALLNYASSYEREWPEHQVERVYRSAAMVFERVWLANPNLLDFRLEMWLKALTHGHRHLPPEAHERIVAYAMAKALVYVVNSGSAAKVLELYSALEEKAYDEKITELVKDPNLRDRRLDLFLLADIGTKNHALTSVQSAEDARTRANALKSAITRYTKIGGRAAQVPDILDTTNEILGALPR